MIESALLCLALNIYHEARGEPLVGQHAVAHVTLNRARERGQRICDVVFDPYQFSWTIKDPKVKDETAWRTALRVARTAYRAGPKADPTRGANHYHATYVRPRWAAGMAKTVRIGQHIFYVDRPLQVASAARTHNF